MSRHRLSGVHNYHDARTAAAKRLPKIVYDYVDGGADDEVTLRRNSADLQDLQLVQESGSWTAQPELATTVLGQRIALPVLIAPTGGLRLVHPHGDIAMAEAAHDLGTILTTPAAAGYALEDVASAPGETKWFQLYKFSNRKGMEELVDKAEAAGYSALVATIDTAVSGNRERDVRNGFSYDLRVNLRNAARLGPQFALRPSWFAGFALDGLPRTMPNTDGFGSDGRALSLADMGKSGAESFSPDWNDIAWLRERWRGPLIVKGIMTVAGARRAADLGADAIVVSNHGGRQLDAVPSTISVLPQIVAAVGDRVEVIMDSGVRRGSDVVKALSLGARAVMVGRLPIWGLALGGRAGARHALELLRDEMTRTMCLMGCASVHDLGPSWLAPVPQE